LIDLTDLACHELKKNSNKTKTDVITAIDELKTELDQQQAKLLEEIEKEFNEKDKMLKIELNQLQYEYQGIKSTLSFTDKILQSGNDLEIIITKDPIINCFHRKQIFQKKRSKKKRSFGE